MVKKTVDSILPICKKTAEYFGYELVDVAVEKENTGKYLRIYLDKEEGITLDDCEKYHRKIQPMVEDVDYDFLEVSSPGIDRPLKTEKDFLRNIGLLVELRFYKSHNGMKNLIATLLEFSNEGITVKTQDQKEQHFILTDLALVKPFIDMEGIDEVIL